MGRTRDVIGPESGEVMTRIEVAVAVFLARLKLSKGIMPRYSVTSSSA